MDKTQIQVKATTAETLHGMKQRGESYEDVIQRLLKFHIADDTIDLEHIPDDLDILLRAAYTAGMNEVTNESITSEYALEHYYYWKDGRILDTNQEAIDYE